MCSDGHECVPFSSCSTDSHVIGLGKSLKFCTNELETCCNIHDITPIGHSKCGFKNNVMNPKTPSNEGKKYLILKTRDTMYFEYFYS